MATTTNTAAPKPANSPMTVAPVPAKASMYPSSQWLRGSSLATPRGRSK
jgi:hypothetical protein